MNASLLPIICVILLALAACDRPRPIAQVDPISPPRPLDEISQLTQVRGEKKLTAQDQSQDSSILDTAESIRKQIQANPDFSAAAKEIVVVSTSESVTLRGNVASAEEKEAIARLTAASTNLRIHNQLKIGDGSL